MTSITPQPPVRPLEEVWLEHRPHLLALAARMLGDATEAEDVLQEAFDRLSRVDTDEVLDVRAWLAVVVRRRCLDRIKSARSRREVVDGERVVEAEVGPGAGAVRPDDPADRATLDEQVQLALAVVLERLSPAERTSFVLHDVFGFPFAAVAEIVGRTPAACRQLASRARRSIQRGDAVPFSAGATPVSTSSLVAERFVAACEGGDITALVAVLDPDVDGIATLLGHGPLVEVRGRAEVAQRLLGLFGPATETMLVPVPMGADLSLVAFRGGTVIAVIQLELADGLVHHIQSFVRLPSVATPASG